MSTEPQPSIDTPDPVLESAWSKLSFPASERMTQEESIRVWELANDMAASYPEGRRILMLHEQLTRELSRGDRCGVCGRFQHPDCGPEC